ncbi:MAG: cupredoxin domain-containing protein [Chloroflexi bacterium]|nr:cupredoxin domain-containing protein [Chloroflexota bacterium]
MNRILFPLFLVTALALAACSGSQAQSGPNTVALKAEALKYNPATIEVTAGQPVTLMFQNADSVEHDFSIMEIPVEMSATAETMAGHDMGSMTSDPQLHMAAKTGQSAALQFTPTKPGTYEFFCTVPGHREAGMKGTLIVQTPG